MGEQRLNPHWRQVALGGTTGAAERHARSRQARMRIMLAAAGLFGRHGYRVVSFGMIAERACVPKGSITSHFPTKLQLARAIVAEMRLRWEDMCSRADARGMDPLSTLLAEATEVISTFPVDPILLGGIRLSDEPEVVPHDTDSYFLFGEARAHKHLSEAQEAGLLLATADVDMLARLVIALLTGHGTVVARHPGHGPNLADRMAETWRLILPFITSPAWQPDHKDA